MSDHFSQPVVGYFDPHCLLAATTCTHGVNFETSAPEELHVIDIPLSFVVTRTGGRRAVGWLCRSLLSARAGRGRGNVSSLVHGLCVYMCVRA